jgi:hypothetical protein
MAGVLLKNGLFTLREEHAWQVLEPKRDNTSHQFVSKEIPDMGQNFNKQNLACRERRWEYSIHFCGRERERTFTTLSLSRLHGVKGRKIVDEWWILKHSCPKRHLSRETGKPKKKKNFSRNNRRPCQVSNLKLPKYNSTSLQLYEPARVK